MLDSTSSRNRVLPLNKNGKLLYKVKVDAKVLYARYDPIK
jgi:hypothetical protein